MLNAKSIYKSIHKSRHIYVYMYDMREHCPPLCWPLLGVEVKHYCCHLLTFFFLSCNTFGERPKLWPGPHSACLCACLRRLGLSECCLCACTGLAFNARWCTGCSLWLMSPIFGRGMHYQQFIYTLCDTSYHLQLTYYAPGRHMFFPH